MMRTILAAFAVSLMFGSTANAAETVAYGYDAQGRLITETHTGTVNNNVQTSYTFDNVDNRTKVTITNASSRVVVVPINGLTVIPISDP